MDATLAQLMATGRPLTWVFAGDSITQGVVHTRGARCWTELVTEAIRWDLGRVFDVCINTGIGGWTAADVQAHVEHLVCRFAPDVVSVALGMNDSLGGPRGLAAFRRDLGSIVVAARTTAPVVALHTPNTIGGGAWNAAGDVAAYAEAVRDVATEHAALLVDHHRHWSERFPEAEPWEWLDEAVHPNAAGHRAMAALVLRTLGLTG